MRLILDTVLGRDGLPEGYMHIDVDPLNPVMMSSPDDPSKQVASHDYIKWLGDNPDKRAAAGWDVLSALPGLPKGTTRYQAVLNQINADSSSPELRALGIK